MKTTTRHANTRFRSVITVFVLAVSITSIGCSPDSLVGSDDGAIVFTTSDGGNELGSDGGNELTSDGGNEFTSDGGNELSSDGGNELTSDGGNE